MCCDGSTSLIVHGELNHIIVASRHMVTPTDWLNWVNVGGGCYREFINSSSMILSVIIIATRGNTPIFRILVSTYYLKILSIPRHAQGYGRIMSSFLGIVSLFTCGFPLAYLSVYNVSMSVVISMLRVSTVTIKTCYFRVSLCIIWLSYGFSGFWV